MLPEIAAAPLEQLVEDYLPHSHRTCAAPLERPGAKGSDKRRLGMVKYGVRLWLLVVWLAACQVVTPTSPALTGQRVMAVESFLADIARQIAGERMQVEALIPPGLDPHLFEPTPQDIARIADSQALIINGAGLESGWLQRVSEQIDNHTVLIEAAAGLEPLGTAASHADHTADSETTPDHEHPHGNPHFWLDPVLTIHYVENITSGLIQLDPAGAEEYRQRAAAYTAQLTTLDSWIRSQVDQLPPERRLLVTNHESLDYFSARYGFVIVGVIVPSTTSAAEPSAQSIARLIDTIRASGAPAIFLETGTNPQVAEQIAAETGVRVVTDLYTHSLSDAGGPAATYIDMMKHNVSSIIQALR